MSSSYQKRLKALSRHTQGYVPNTFTTPQEALHSVFPGRRVTIIGIDGQHETEVDVNKQKPPVNVTRSIASRVSPPEYDAFEDAMKKAGIKNKSDAVREALRLFCESQGIDYPETEYQWGGKHTP
jgi:hypothetical protein